ncbi:MAG: FG-GAP-like repeat-containing protein [Bryobacteraceae bacterium]
MRTIVQLLLAALPGCSLTCRALAGVEFRAQEIQRDFGVAYAVSTADVNGDGKPDIVAINHTQLVWFENPTWRKHVVMDGGTKKDNVCFAPHDIDGDGKVDFAIGADWQPSNTSGGGSLQWIGNAGGAVHPLGEEPTLHRIRWGDVDGDGKAELVVVPLHGRGNKGPAWEGQGARILIYRVPKDPARDPWPVEVADDSLRIVHNFIVTNFDKDPQEEIITASREGVNVLKRGQDGKWSKTHIGDGSPGEIKLGRLGRTRFLATVEPWHGNSVVIYKEQSGKWAREVIETQLTGAHALGWGDFDGDGADELAVGWRDKQFGVAVYKRGSENRWSRAGIVDDGGMAAEDLVVADLNGDGRPEIIAGGRSTKNVKIYWNESKPQWTRHVVAEGYRNQTAIAADFTGDGKVDVIANDFKRTILYVAPDWTPIVLQTGVHAIHSEVMDVDGDGRMDYIGARYTPGLIFWLQQPKDALRETWTYRAVDDFAAGGVNGIHGLMKGDVDGDGKPDLIGNSAQPKGNFPESLAWFKVPPNPLAAPRWERYIFANRDAPGLSHYLGFGDVNGDGRPDLASAAKVPEGGNWFAWWEAPARNQLKTAAWRKHVIAENQEGATNILMADVNGDHRTDFVATRGHGRGVVWYEAPEWTPHEINPALTYPHSLATGDIDGDGDVDLATCAYGDFIAAWFENDGKGNFKTHHIYEDQAAYDVRLVDMDGDGDLDLLVAGQESQNVVWYENRLKP